jgi:hypothetical protein
VNNYDEAVCVTEAPQGVARSAGLLYLAIIVLGLTGELVVCSGIVAAGDAAATAANIRAAEGLFRFGFVADSIMLLADIALAVLLYVLLRPVNRTLALMAMCFRLVQAAIIGGNLLHYHAALLALAGPAYGLAFPPEQLAAVAALFLDLHSHGYDLALLPFGINCLLLGYLVYRSGFLPRTLGVLLSAAGVVYLVGSYTRFLFPAQVEAVAPIYLVAIVAESAMCLWLLLRGVNVQAWKQRA